MAFVGLAVVEAEEAGEEQARGVGHEIAALLAVGAELDDLFGDVLWFVFAFGHAVPFRCGWRFEIGSRPVTGWMRGGHFLSVARTISRKMVTEVVKDCLAAKRATEGGYVPLCRFAVWMCTPALHVSDYGGDEAERRGADVPQYLYRVPGLRKGISLRLEADEDCGGTQRGVILRIFTVRKFKIVHRANSKSVGGRIS